MRYFITLILTLTIAAITYADTIDHYLHIANNIPQMEIKADPQAQAWARSARNVLAITNESIAETLLQANEVAQKQGHPLFCLPPDVKLDSMTMNGLIMQTYQNISSQQSDKDKMTVSQIAWLGITTKYPCTTNDSNTGIQHVSALLSGSSH